MTPESKRRQPRPLEELSRAATEQSGGSVFTQANLNSACALSALAAQRRPIHSVTWSSPEGRALAQAAFQDTDPRSALRVLGGEEL